MFGGIEKIIFKFKEVVIVLLYTLYIRVVRIEDDFEISFKICCYRCSLKVGFIYIFVF